MKHETMARTLNDKLAQLPHERRERIETHVSNLIAEEVSLQKLREARGRTKARVAKDGYMSGCVKIERGSGNVFRDLAFSKAEAKNLALRSLLMSEIREIARSMTKAKAVKRFGITQARLEDLLRGRIDRFSVDALMNMATAGGLHVQLRTAEVP